MCSWLRAALACLLAAALPLQGVAAATMLHCGQDEQAAAHVHAATASASHHGHHHEMKLDSAPRTAGKTGAAAKSGCSVCASCCLATALPAAIHPFDTTLPTESFAMAFAAVAPVFLTGGPERPPRPLHA